MKYLLVILFVFGLIAGINFFNTEKPVHKVQPKLEQKNWITPEPPSLPPARPLETKTPKPATLPPKRNG